MTLQERVTEANEVTRWLRSELFQQVMNDLTAVTIKEWRSTDDPAVAEKCRFEVQALDRIGKRLAQVQVMGENAQTELDRREAESVAKTTGV